MTLFEYPVLFIFCLLLPLLLSEDDQILAPTTIALLNDAHHMSFLHCLVETEVIIEDLLLEVSEQLCDVP